MQDEISFGSWLRKQRRSLDLTQQALANQIGCAEVTLRRIEAETLKPSKHLVQMILQKFAIPQDDWSQWILFARGLSDFPLTSSPSSGQPITNLPASLTSFIGREKEQVDVIRLITKHRLVTLTGAGGVGKTRLSLRVGEQVLEDYADGVWFVEYAPILDLLLVPRVTAIAIGLGDEPQRPVIDMLSDYLREKKMLIILDNCEHLLDALAELAGILLKSCSGLKILATSREALGIPGEAVYSVPSLEVPDTRNLLENFRGIASVRLFEERAQLARTDFSLTLENVPFVAKICSRLDGIPLAIELAAAQIKMFSTKQIAVRLQKRFRLLTTGSRGVPPRHRTLQAAIDWSYDLLSPVEQTVFHRLSVFINGWTLNAAEFICSDANILPEAILSLLTQLTNKSLVITVKTPMGTRYRMLETIRDYANEKLIESGEKDITQDRHLQYFLNLVENAELHLMRVEQLDWLPLLDADYENVRFAFEWALKKDVGEISLRLCNALWWFWKIRGRWREGVNWTKKALAKPWQVRSKNEKVTRARALCTEAALEWQVGNFKHMLSPAQESLALASEVSDKKVIAIAGFYVGIALARHGEAYDRSLALLEQSLTELQALHEEFWQAYFDPYLSELFAAQAKRKLQDRFVRSLELARKVGERLILMDVLSHYATWLFTANRLDEARKRAEEAERLCKQIGIRRPGERSFVLAAIASLEGDIHKSRSIYVKMQERYSLLGEKHFRSVSASQLSFLAMEEGNLQEARKYIEQSLQLSREAGSQAYIALRLIELSNLFYRHGEVEEFQRHAREGLASRKHFLEAHKVIILKTILGSLYAKKPENSAQILGAVNNSTSEYDLSPAEPMTRTYCERAESYIREVLGDEVFEEAFFEGQKISLDEALDLALKTVEEI